MLDNGVALAGVNVMAMDFTSAPRGMYAAITGALNGTHSQLTTLLRAQNLTSGQIWNRMGVTVMIGQNDVAGQIVTVADAKGVAVVRAQPPPRPRLDVVAQPRQPVRQPVRPHRRALQHLQRNGADAARVQQGAGIADRKRQREPPGARGQPGAVAARRTAAPWSTTRRTRPSRSGTRWRPTRAATRSFARATSTRRSGTTPGSTRRRPRRRTPRRRRGRCSVRCCPAITRRSSRRSSPAPTRTGRRPSPIARARRCIRDGLGYQAKYYTQGDDPAQVLTNPSGSPWKALYTIPGEPAPTG